MELLANHGQIPHKELVRSFMITKDNGGQLGENKVLSRSIVSRYGIFLAMVRRYKGYKVNRPTTNSRWKINEINPIDKINDLTS